MVIREAKELDLTSIVEIENHAIRTGVAHFACSDVTVDAAEQAWRAAQGRYPWLVADIDGRVAGFARAGAWQTREAYARSVQIGIYLRPESQGRGIGTALYEVLFPRLRDGGFHTIIAGITLPNEASVRLHERFGLKPIGVFPEVGYKMGAWRSVGYWALVLPE